MCLALLARQQLTPSSLASDDSDNDCDYEFQARQGRRAY